MFIIDLFFDVIKGYPTDRPFERLLLKAISVFEFYMIIYIFSAIVYKVCRTIGG